MKKLQIITFIMIVTQLLFISGCLDQNEKTPLPYETLSKDGLTGFWMFNEDQSWNEQHYDIIDASGNGNNGKANGSVQEKKASNDDACAYFDGTDDYILVENAPSLEPEQISIELWVKAPAQHHSFSYLLSKGGNNCNISSYAISSDPSKGICFSINSNSKIFNTPHSGISVWDDKWHHIAGTFDNTIMRLYVDGQEIQNGTYANTAINYNLTHHTNLIIGNYIGSCTFPFSGCIDNVLLWNKALTSEEIYHHYLLGLQAPTSTIDTIPSVSLDNAKSKIKTMLEPYSVNEILIIKGSQLSIQDNLILTMVETQIENAQDIKQITDNTCHETILEDYDLLILLGSERSNLYTDQLFSTGRYVESSVVQSTPFIMHFGSDINQDKEIFIAYLITEPNNQQNYGVEKSLLHGFIDKKFIPLIATSVSILLIYLWSLFGNTLSEFIFDFISEHIADRKMRKIKSTEKKTDKKTYRKKILKEGVATILAIIVFSLAMSWTWSSDINEFQKLLIINFFIITIVFVIREIIRILLSKKYEMETKHVFWPFGAVLTLASTILGNTFSLASFTMLENDEQQKKFGKMYYFIFKLFYVIGLLFFIANFFYPTIYFQMTYVFLMMSIVIDMTPVEPMDGYDVRFWNKRKWLGLYIIVIFSYIIMNFSISLQL